MADGFQRLSTSDELVVIGYSFPQTDQVIRHFLSTSRFAGPATVVDRRDDPAEALGELLPAARIGTFTGPDAIQSYADASAGDIVKWGTTRIDGHYAASVLVNDQTVSLPEEHTTYPNYEAALSAARAYVDVEWPALAERDDDLHRVPSESGPMQIAYVHPAP